MAGFNLGDILVNIKANTDGLKKGLNDVQDMGSKTKTMGESIQSGLRTASVGLAVVGAGLTVYAKKATDYTEDLVKSSKALGREIGVSTEEASRLSAALGRMGIDADKAQTVFGIFSKKIVEATNTSEASRIAQQNLQLQIRQTQVDISKTTDEIAKNGDKTGELGLKVETLKNKMAGLQDQLKTSSNAFDQLGVSTKNADGTQKGFTQILGEVADKFKAMPDGIDKTALSMELFGRSGKDMIKVLNLGSDGIADLEKQADKLGLTLTADTVTKVEALVKAQKDLKQETDAMKISVGTATAPVLTEYNKKLTELTQTMINAKEPFHSLTVNTLAFGGPIASAGSGVTAFLGNLSSIGPKVAGVATKLGVIGLAIAVLSVGTYELWTHFQGVDDAVTNFGQHIMNVLAPAIMVVSAGLQPFIAALQVIWQIIVSQLGPAFGQMWDAIQRLWVAINPAFVDLLKVLGVILAVTLVAAIALLVAFLAGLAQTLSWVASGVSNAINWVANFIGWIGTAAVAVANAVGAMAQWFLYLPLSVANAINSVVNWFASLPGRILGAMGSLGSLLYNAGKQMIQGMINGITDVFSTLANKVKDAVGKAVSGVKSFLGIKSPSKVFEDIGKNVGLGFVNGINNTAQMAADAMMNLGAGVIAPTIGLNSAVAGNVQNSTSTTNIGTINIQNRADADYLLASLDRNHQLESMGLSPAS